MKSDTVDGGDADRARDDLSHFHQLTEKLLVTVEDFLCGLIDTLAFACELKLLLATVDKQRCEVFLHRSCLLANG